jgi:hypothetical protein
MSIMFPLGTRVEKSRELNKLGYQYVYERKQEALLLNIAFFVSQLSPIHSEMGLRNVDLTVQQFGPHAQQT